MLFGPRKPDFDLSSELEFEEYAPQLREQKPRLRPDTDVVPQTFRGARCFVLQDPVSLQYYRIGLVEREILAQMDGQTTLGTVYDRMRKKHGNDAPSFRELAQFALMLRHANLTVPDPGEESRWGVERAMKKRRDRRKQKFASFMYVTIPLVDPERFLNATMPYVRWVFSRGFLLVWLLTIGAAIVAFFYNAAELMRPANGILAPGNLVLLYVSFMLIKGCHELGHAYAAKNQGAEVHRMGVMFLIFMPLLYVDTTPVWAFPGKWHKVLVGCGGMMTELFIAALALFAWLSLEPSLLRTILYNMIFIASVSTILFNGNPLLRYDAYYILADYLEIANLRQRSSEYLLYLVKRYVIGQRLPASTDSPREKAWFVGYGVLSTLYRCVIVTGIILFIASKLFFIGVALAVGVAVLWVLTPLVKVLKYVFFAKETRPVRARAVLVTGATAAALFVLLGVQPVASSVRVPCAMEPHELQVLRADWPGFLDRVFVCDGQHVTAGQTLAVMSNEQLDFSILRLQKTIAGARARYQRLVGSDPAAAQAVAYRLEMLEKDLAQLREHKESLTIRAPFDGQVIAPELERVGGLFLQRGDQIFTVASLGKLRVIAVVDGADVPVIRSALDAPVRIKFRSTPDRVFEGIIERVRPAATTTAPPISLTNVGGGDVLMDPEAPDRDRTLLPWYRVDVVLDQGSEAPPVGVTGTARFLVGRQPLGEQFWLRLRRVLHRRFLI